MLSVGIYASSSIKFEEQNDQLTFYLCLCGVHVCVFFVQFFKIFLNQLDCISVFSFIKVPFDIDSIVIICGTILFSSYLTYLSPHNFSTLA